MVNVVFGNGQLALNYIVKLELILNRAGAAETQYPRLACIQLGLDVLNRAVAPNGILAVVAEVFLVGFLLLTHSSQIFLGAEAGISLSLGNQFLGKHVIQRSSLPLTVRAVVTEVATVGRAFVKGDAVMLQGVNQHLHRARHFPFGIGIFYTQKQHTAALVSHTLRDQTLYQITQMDKAGRGGRHTGDDCALGGVTGGEFCLSLLRTLGHIGKQ